MSSRADPAFLLIRSILRTLYNKNELCKIASGVRTLEFKLLMQIAAKKHISHPSPYLNYDFLLVKRLSLNPLLARPSDVTGISWVSCIDEIMLQ
jgi:hypothetical protein